MQKHNSYSVNEALQKLQNYCTYQERCHHEARQKLISMRMIPEAIDTIIVDLIRDNYLNETRFAKMFVSGKFRIKKWGKRRLILELKKKNIAKFNIDQAINEINNDDYFDTFNILAERRCELIKEANIYKKRKKLADYLLYRGWETHLVYDKVKELIK